MKRVFLLIATNLAIMLVLGLVTTLTGANRFFTSAGLDLGKLLFFAAIMGFGGAFLSLWMSKTIAKWSTGARVIETPQNSTEFWLFETVRRFLPHIRKGGSVQFITTFLTQVGFPGLSIYSASKAALKSFSQTLAAELAPKGIRVNSIAPGPIGTPLWGTVGLPPDVLNVVAQNVTARLMPGAFGQPEDIAQMSVFLASDAAKNIYGQEIVIDGGYTIS